MAVQKYKKKELLKIVCALWPANDPPDDGDKNAADDGLIKKLTQCQETALSLGSYFETSGEGNVPLVRILEDYCETIYQMSLCMTDIKRYRELTADIRGQLELLEREIQTGLPDDRLEAVFLPYKVSMWDSLESVWIAAQKDELCDAYVVPVPYFDKNPDGSLGQMHYEGNEYPDYVPVVSWKEYSFEEHRPDMIFIHYPYDECNMVTNIHPAYYSQNLKRYTDMLVYIPYFITMGNRINNEFCVLPGVLNADKVIVESENVRRTYVEEISKIELQNPFGNASGSPEEKVVALGSPKFDKVIGNAEKTAAIPGEWTKKLRKPDGAGKKAILYNTGITAFLGSDEQMLKKINDVLHTFREKQSEVTLLWRPHPLIAATLQSMRPFLWEEYRKIVERYRKEDWGIYDDTQEFKGALSVCDGMISDPSSLVPLVRSAGKPVMLQDISETVRAEDRDTLTDYKKLACRQPAFDGVNYWLANRRYNALIRLNRADGETEWAGFFPGEEMFQTDLYFKSLYYNGKIYFAPFRARNIAIYDIHNRKFITVPLKPVEELGNYRKERIDINAPKMFHDIIPSGNYIYFTPAASYPALIRLNSDNDEAVYMTDFLNVIDEQYFRYFEYYSFRKCFLIEDKLLITSFKSDSVIEFSLKTESSKITYINDANISSILKRGGHIGEYVRCGNDFWITMVLPALPFYYRSILQWKYADNKIVRYTDLKALVNYEEGSHFLTVGGVVSNESIWYISDYPEKSVRIDITSGKVTASSDFNLLSELAEEAGRNLVYNSIDFSGYELCCFCVPDYLNVMIEWDTKNKRFQRFDLVLDDNTASFYAEQKQKENLQKLAERSDCTVFRENIHCNIEEFIKISALVSESEKVKENGDYINSGERIFNYVKHQISGG